MAKVAFLGLGVMGYPMAGHLKNRGGHDVTVYNRTAAKAGKWVAEHGGRAASYVEEAGSRIMKHAELTVRIDLARGAAAATVWTCDFSYDYVKINADYRS